MTMDAKIEIKRLFASLSSLEQLAVLDDLRAITSSATNTISVPEVETVLSKLHNALESDVKTEKLPFGIKLLVICPECGTIHVIKWGHYRGEKRYKCKECNHTFTNNTRRLSYGIQKTTAFQDFGELMFSGHYYSISYMAKLIGISRNTAFDWRHKYLNSIGSAKVDSHFSTEIEMDDVWILFNEKGRKGIENPHHRGGTGSAGDNANQVKLLFTVERDGDIDISLVCSGRLKAIDVENAVGSDFDKGAVLYSDKHASIGAFAKMHPEICHQTFTACKHTDQGNVHVQHLNQMALELKKIINGKMKGVATKYLQNYANWFKFDTLWQKISNKYENLINHIFNNNYSWDQFICSEFNYHQFLENHTTLDFSNPIKRTWKSCLWNQERISKMP